MNLRRPRENSGEKPVGFHLYGLLTAFCGGFQTIRDKTITFLDVF
jgi:hypothetical protein